jgi:hypothetical protein
MKNSFKIVENKSLDYSLYFAIILVGIDNPQKVLIK